MIAGALREEGQVTLPQKIREAAGLATGDQAEWTVQAGEIRGRKLARQPERRRIVARLVTKGNALIYEWPKGYKLAPAAIERAVREERENQ